MAASDANALVDERERLRAQMLAYCERDTWARVHFANAFIPVARRAGTHLRVISEDPKTMTRGVFSELR